MRGMIVRRGRFGLECSNRKHISHACLLAWIVAAHLACLVVVVVYLWAEVFYFNDPQAVAYLTHGAADQPPAPRASVAVGSHTFGDFLLPYAQALVPNPWTDYGRRPQNYPSGLVTFYKLLTLLPYGVALPLFLLAAVVSMLVPMLVATRGLPVPVKVCAYCVLIFMTSPFVMVIDRGNVQGLLVVPLFVFASAWRQRRWSVAMWALVAASILKLYPIVLVVTLVAERKWRFAGIALAVTAAATLGLFALYPGSLTRTLVAFGRALVPFSAPNPLELTRGNYSAVGMCTNFVAAVSGVASPVVRALGTRPWFAGIAYAAFVTALLFAEGLPFVVRLALAMTLLSMVVPVSYGYTLVFVFVVVAELVREASHEYEADTQSEGIRRSLAVPLAVAIVVTLVPIPVPLPGGFSSFGTILVPGAWLAFSLCCARSLYPSGRSSGLRKRARTQAERSL